MRRFLPEIMLLYSATMWGLVWYPLRLLDQGGINGLWQTLISYGAASLVLLWPFLKGRPVYQNRLDFLWLALAAGWCNVSFVLAMLQGEVLRVLLLFYLSPVWAILIAYFMIGEKLSWKTIAVLVVAMSGAVLMLYEPQQGGFFRDAADWLALSSGFTFALSNVFIRKMQEVRLVDKVMITWIGVVTVSFVGLLLTGISLPQAGGHYFLGAVALGVIGFVTMTFAVQYGVTRIPIQRSAVILLFELVAGGVSAAWVANEYLQINEWIGGALIIAAGLWSIKPQPKRIT